MKISVKKTILIILGLLFFLAISFSYIYNKGIPHDKPNIIFITIDALRPGNLHCYGYQRQTSPNIDKLADKSTTFLNCFVVSTNTPWSTVTFLTGRYLFLEAPSLAFHLDNVLDERYDTLAEYLKGFGYYTAAFLDNNNYRSGRGFEQGFDYYKCYPYDEKNLVDKIRDRIMTEDIVDFINNYKSNKPFFLWIHYLDPHAPYTPSQEDYDLFKDDDIWKKSKFEKLELCPQEITSDYEGQGYIPRYVFQEGEYFAPHYIASYDAEIRGKADAGVGKIVEQLKDKDIVIISADHGESLGEHGIYFTHGENIYDELLHVPLVIRDQEYFDRGKKISQPVSLLDIVPTIIKRVNPVWYFFNKHRFDGKDLKAITATRNARRYLYAYKYAAKMFSIRDIATNFKYIMQDNKEELYKLPDENNNLITNDFSPETISIRDKLNKTLREWLQDYPVKADINPKEVEVNKEERESFRSLGYLQ